MEKVQFRGFIFPHNPEKIEISYQSNLANYHLPGKGEITKNLGNRVRTVICKGAFFGSSPVQPEAQKKKFLETLKNEQSGLLFLPNTKPFYAFVSQAKFSSLEDGKILPYSLVFVEEG